MARPTGGDIVSPKRPQIEASAIEALRDSPATNLDIKPKKKSKSGKGKKKSKAAAIIVPRVGIVNLPPELLEYVALLLTDPPSNLWVAEQAFLATGCSSFCISRFNIASFSRACSTTRAPAERILYRDIQLDFSGWPGASKNSFWPAATLHLLLRTLNARPSLGPLVRSVKFDWVGDMMRSFHGRNIQKFQQGVCELLRLCPRVSTVACDNLPLDMAAFKPEIIDTLTTDSPSVSGALRKCGSLRNLYIHNVPAVLWMPNSHKLVVLRMDGLKQNAHEFCFGAIQMCGTSVQHLQLALPKPYLDPPFPAAIPSTLPSDAGSRLQSITLEGVHILDQPHCGLGKLFKRLPNLRDLEFVGFNPLLHVALFEMFPPSLRSFTASFDGRDNKFGDHMFALGQALEYGTEKTKHVPTRVEVHGEGTCESSPETRSLRYIHRACEGKPIGFHRTGLDKDGEHRIRLDFLVKAQSD